MFNVSFVRKYTYSDLLIAFEDFITGVPLKSISEQLARSADGGSANEITATWLLYQFRNCQEILPSMLCGEVDIPQGSTYAQAARKLIDASAVISRVVIISR